MKNIWLCAGLACCAVFLLSGCGKPSVKVVKAAKTAQPFVYEAEVRPEALHSLPVVPQVSGQIVSALPDVGTEVKAGQLLFQIDSASYEGQAAELESRIAASASAPAPVYQAPPDDSMEASLLRQGIITRAEYDRIQGRKGAVSSAPAASPEPDTASLTALQALRKAIADCRIVSPIDGVVSQLYITDQKLAAAGQPALVIRQNTPVIASVQIPSALDGALQEAKADKTLTVSLTDKEKSRTWYGELKPQPNETGEEYTVYKVQADNPDNALVIGDVYQLRIDTGRTVEGYLIPASAFVKPDQIEVVNANHLIDIRTVVAVDSGNGSKLVIRGLAEGDAVVEKPTDALQLGMEVSLQ